MASARAGGQGKRENCGGGTVLLGRQLRTRRQGRGLEKLSGQLKKESDVFIRKGGPLLEKGGEHVPTERREGECKRGARKDLPGKMGKSRRHPLVLNKEGRGNLTRREKSKTCTFREASGHRHRGGI